MDDNIADDTAPCQYEDIKETKQLGFQMKKSKKQFILKLRTYNKHLECSRLL